MNAGLESALDKAQLVYQDLVDIANDMVEGYTEPIDKLLNNAKDNVIAITNDQIRELLFRLSLCGWQFSDIKEKAALRRDCMTALKDEAYAKAFNSVEGAQGAKQQQALLATQDELLAEVLCDLVASLLKTKLDELHRIVDTLKTILTTRLTEAKLNVTVVGD